MVAVPVNNFLRDPANNWQIDPARNWQIDPFRSNNIPGLFAFSTENKECCYFTVKVTNQDLLLFFDVNKKFCFYAVGVLGSYCVFSVENSVYSGYLCANGIGGFNWFGDNGLWNFFLV